MVLIGAGEPAGAASGANAPDCTESFTISKAARLGDRQATAIALELGVHNATLAIAVGAALDTSLTIPAAVYSAFMFITGGLFAWFMSRRNAGGGPDASGDAGLAAGEPAAVA